MGKLPPSPHRLQQLARDVITSTNRPRRQSQINPVFETRSTTSPESTGLRPDLSEQLRLNKKKLKMEAENSEQRRVPLAEVVVDCVKRWFQDTLKEAKAGDTAMQVLVGQMYYSGYGVPKDAQKGRAWINRASKADLRYGKLEISIQVIMQVTRILITQRNLPNRRRLDFR